MYKFAPAERHEARVFGAARPKYTQKSVEQWIEFMQRQKVKRICCLLENSSLNHYPIDLLATYRRKFTAENVLWQPLKDFQIPQSQILIEHIIPFLICADRQQQKVVIHCSGGVGRTGIVLAVWLVSQRGFSNQQGLSAVKQNKRYPQEAIIAALLNRKNPCRVKQQLNDLLNDCRDDFK